MSLSNLDIIFSDEASKILERKSGNLLIANDCEPIGRSSAQTNTAFSKKWEMCDYESEEFKKLTEEQQRWYLELYGFETEQALSQYLVECDFVLDAGAGSANKAAWFASLSPKTHVLAVDLSSSVIAASEYYHGLENLTFIQADLAKLSFFKSRAFDYISCDQVIHHTHNPQVTLAELVRLMKTNTELALYVYRKKALPRELLDEHFRTFSKELSYEELFSLSEQLTQLGKVLHELNVDVEVPDIPILGIKGGKMDLQRFVYWNFIKCYWNESQGVNNSNMINFDWYSPSQACRYSYSEFLEMIAIANLETNFFHEEEACFSGRFEKLLQNLSPQNNCLCSEN